MSVLTAQNMDACFSVSSFFRYVPRIEICLTVTIRAELCGELSVVELLYQKPTGGSLSKIHPSMMASI